VNQEASRRNYVANAMQEVHGAPAQESIIAQPVRARSAIEI